jgi:hypothetical protein
MTRKSREDAWDFFFPTHPPTRGVWTFSSPARLCHKSYQHLLIQNPKPCRGGRSAKREKKVVVREFLPFFLNYVDLSGSFEWLMLAKTVQEWIQAQLHISATSDVPNSAGFAILETF